jgi:2-polyprenyl-6-methoxyphenol hydroxylase-like FAD-dependent oxidoreductase
VRVIIAGAGLGGLTLALSLQAVGIEAEIYEAAPALRPVGVGINLLPHAVRELTELGLAERIAERAIATEALVYANRFGQEIWREPRGRLGYAWPQYSIHRGALQQLLLDAVVERLGPDAVHPDRAVAAVKTTPTGALARLRDSADADQGQATGELVVGADGIHSAALR